MWLINAITLELEEFKDPDHVQYAILSHTWADGEVDFHDMGDPGLARRKAGWHKIRKTCDIARAHGCSHAWIDTCCIDKSSSEGISEAINSMFSYYRKSFICLAYLADLQATEESFTNAAADSQDSRIKENLEGCRWFTRGWTLQELIAADNVLFYNSSWLFVASKSFISRQLSEITGIDASVLKDVDNLPDVPVGRRMAWASHRQTTRVEDMAYCLIGIFGIAMPPLYGEGNRAFTRLQEEIARNSNDLTLFAWEQEDTKSYQFREIFAHSPLEFRHCANLRVQPPRFEAENEFTLTNRGLRIESNLDYLERRNSNHNSYQDEHLLLGLDCLECSPRTGNSPRWVAITLERFGSVYVRSSPECLKYLHSRAARTSSKMRRKRPNKLVAYIARSLTSKDLMSLQSKALVSLVFRPGMQPGGTRYFAEGTKGADYTEIFEVVAPRNFVDYMKFPGKLWPGVEVAKPAVLFGFQGPSNELWAMPYFVDQLYEGSDLESDTGLSPAEAHRERLAVVRDYVFTNFSDPSGLLDTKFMPMSVELRDWNHPTWVHRFSVRYNEGSNPPHGAHVPVATYSLVFVHTITDEQGDATSRGGR